MQPLTGDPALYRGDLPRPLVPLSATDLLVNARGEPALAHALAHEIPSADSIDLLCAFVRWHGLRVLMDPLTAHCRAGKPLRVITTVYTGSTERKALDWLVRLGAQVKCRYDTQSTRLHAKAWLFRRGPATRPLTSDRRTCRSRRCSTASSGTSGCRRSARRTCSRSSTPRSRATGPARSTRTTGPTREQRRASIAPWRQCAQDTLDAPLTFLDVAPWPHQREILEKLDAERQRHGRWKNLVVAATGTGKTVVAALDYKRLRHEKRSAPTRACCSSRTGRRS